MIHSVLRQALRTRGDEPAVLCHTGDRESTLKALSGLRLRPGDLRVDLDHHPLGEPFAIAGVGGQDQPDAVGLVAVVAASLTDLRRHLVTVQALPRTVHLVTVVVDTPGHHGPLVPGPPGIDEWNDLLESRVRRVGKRGWICELFFPNSVETGQALDCVVHGTTGGRRGGRVTPLAGVQGVGAARWRPGDTAATGVSATGPVPLRRVSPVSDLVVRAGDRQPPLWEDAVVPHLDVPAVGARADVSDPVTSLAPIDEQCVNPVGFTKKAGGPLGDLSARGGRTVLREGEKVLATVPEDGTVTDLDVGRVRYLRGVRVDWSGHARPVAVVRAVVALAAAGVPVVSGPVPDWAAALGPELTATLTRLDATELADPLSREEHSVRLRRAALRAHGQRARWRALAERAGVPVPPDPLVSVMLCTRRPELVGFALAQVARQRGVRFELVLALHGFSAGHPEVGPAVAEFAATGIPITVYEAPADQVFGAVLNDAVDRTSGSVVAKWDDDDWYGPEHLADMVMARAYSCADLVGVTQDLVYLEELDLTVWRSYQTEKPSPDVVGSTIVVDRSVLRDVGGFRPLPRAIDSQLLLAVRRHSGRIYRTHGLGYLLRRAGQGHTWGADMGYFLRRSTRQWSGWRPSSLLEGEPAPLGRPESGPGRTLLRTTEYTGGQS
ncbi:glycosyltransferase [Nocardiopsis sp. NPDC006938]|uniref:glycosyltransferase n=1 Tax=Nocardiopsis sp. NPDC006938 TaxID=3364337 RepID=UPI00367A8803